MTRPRLLDLFGCEGGGAMGYHRAGFDVVGVDIVPQPRYPFPMIVCDALSLPVSFLRLFDAVHASPPCQRYSVATKATGNPDDHPDLYRPTRDMLEAAGVPYVIENVVGSPVRPDVTLCGSMFGMQVRRHRVFELGGWFAMQTGCAGHRSDVIDVSGTGGSHTKPRTDGKGGRTSKPRNAEHAREVMGMPWASRYGCAQAVPPAYTDWIGEQLISHVL